MNLSNWKLILGGGGIIVVLLSLANHVENNGIREEEASKWELAIAKAKATVVRDTVKIPIPQIIGTAKSDTPSRNWEHFAETIHSNNDQTPEKCDSLLQYCNYILQPFVVVADTAGAQLEMTANPRSQTIDYKLTLPPKEVEHISTTNEILAPVVEKSWLIGLDFGYHEEPRIGGLLGKKPIVAGIDYFPESDRNKWGGHLSLIWEF